MQRTRRNVLAGIGATLAVGAGATQVFGQSNGGGIDVEEVNYEGEYVVFINNSDSKIDVSGYTVALEYNSDRDQDPKIPDETSIAAGGTLKVATGYKDVPDADVTFDYDRGMLRDDRSDVVALLDTNGDVVATSEDDNSSTITTTETETTTTEDGDGDDTTTETTTTEEESGGEETTTTTEDDSSDESTTTSGSSESGSESDGAESTDDSGEESSSKEDC